MNCDSLSEYQSDKRIACKYGVKCFQKNPLHHKKYKHPPKNDSTKTLIPPKKKRKIETRNDSESDNDIDDTKDLSADAKLTTDPSEKDKIETDTDKTEAKQTLHVSESNTKKIEPVSCSKQEKKSYSPKEFIKENFLVDMPDDFYSFWDFCKSLNPEKPIEALKDFELILVGPFDVLAGKFEDVTKSKEEILTHWRYYYDPPEFQTVIKGNDKIGFHIGYFRDSPDEAPVFLASNNSGLNDCAINPMAPNIFGTINAYLESHAKRCDPFNKIKVKKILDKLDDWSKKHSFTLDKKSDAMQRRKSKVVTRTFNNVGIVVPYNKKTELGYRPLIESNDKVKKILKNIKEAQTDSIRDKHLSELQPIITMASIAADECDFGTSLELGLDLFAFGGSVFHLTILSLLTSAYSLLKRKAFSEVIVAHLKNRKKGTSLSII